MVGQESSVATWSSLLICGGHKTWSKSPYSGTLSDHVSTFCREKGESLNEWIERVKARINANGEWFLVLQPFWYILTGNHLQLYRTLHETDQRPKEGITRTQFFLIALTCSFAYYALPGYLFAMLSSLSWVCWAWPNSVTAQQIGSGYRGLGVGAIALDWAAISSYLLSPLATPFFAIANIFVGFILVMYVITPIAYWNNLYDAKTFPVFSSKFFQANGQQYNINQVIDSKFQLNETAYESYGRLHLSTFFAFTYGVGFAALTATLSHVILYHGWYIPLNVLFCCKQSVNMSICVLISLCHVMINSQLNYFFSQMYCIVSMES
jgi:hypothetical protein